MEKMVVLVAGFLAIVSVFSIPASGTYTPEITVPFQYPLFKQCNSSWGNNIMINTTICDVGCLMSSISMALNGFNIKINGQDSNPATLNTWLRNNGGYDNDNDLSEEVIYKISPARIAYNGPIYGGDNLSPQKIKSMLDSRIVTIANVMHGRHFVLMIGYDSGNTRFYVNDPGFSTTYYNYSDIVAYRIFTMQPN